MHGFFLSGCINFGTKPEGFFLICSQWIWPLSTFVGHQRWSTLKHHSRLSGTIYASMANKAGGQGKENTNKNNWSDEEVMQSF